MTTFITDAYVMSHGKAPRGYGHWAFVPFDSCWPDGEMPFDAIAWAYGTYSAAKQTVATAYPSIKKWLVLS